MNIIQSLIIAISMYSKIPMPQTEWKKENMKYAMCFFPLVGVIIGGVIWLVGKGVFALSCGTLFRAAVFTLLPILISGGIHIDGFMDTMDALASYGDKEKKLAILKDSHAGAFAILGLGCYLVWSLAVWSEVTEEMLGVIAGIFVISRALSGISVVSFQSAREHGLAKTFQDGARKRNVQLTMVGYLILAMGIMLWQNAIMAAAAAIAAALIFIYYRAVCRKQFGGVTGDLAGYFLVLAELAMVTIIVVCGGRLWNCY